MKLPVKVIPASSRDCIVGWLGEALKIRVTAPAERGKANAAAEKLIADALGTPKERVRLVAGRSSGRKLIEIDGLCEADIRERLFKHSRL